jgi:hypothetical protein
MSNTTETRTLKLDTPVVVRKVPMSKRGCSTLRAIRDYQQKMYKDKNGVEVEIPFPTAIHLALEDYVRLLKIDVQEEGKPKGKKEEE